MLTCWILQILGPEHPRMITRDIPLAPWRATPGGPFWKRQFLRESSLVDQYKFQGHLLRVSNFIMSLALLRKPTRVDKISQALPQLSRGWQLGSLPAPNSFHCFVSLGTKELTHASAWSLELCQLLIQMSKLTSLKGDRQHLLLQAFKLRELTEKFKW